jgi:outer membrane protein TolC
MKTLTTILFVTAGLANLQAAESVRTVDPVNAVVISAGYIDQLVVEARTNNPALKAAESRVRSATLNAEAVRTWDDPMANFGGSVFGERGFKPSAQGDLSYGIQQNLPLWGRPGLNRNVASAQASALTSQQEFQIQETRRDITKALLDAALAGKVVAFDEQDVAWLNATAKAVDSKYRSGQAALGDNLQLQNEVAEGSDTLLTDRHQLEHDYLALNRLVNREVGGSWPPLQLPELTPAVPFSEKLVSLALASEPRLKVLSEEIRQGEAKAALTKRSRLPDVSLGVEGWQYSGDGQYRSGTFTVNFTLPWLNESKYYKDYRRDNEALTAVQEERDDQAWMVREELDHLTVEIEALRREALLYRHGVGARAAQALSSRVSDWESGHGTLQEVLDARRFLLDSQLKAARAVAKQQQAVAELLLWTGLSNIQSLEPLLNEPSLISHHETHGQ